MMVPGLGRIVPDSSKPAALYLYVLGAAFLGVSALFGGGNLMFNPTGSTLNMSLELLSGTPFGDFLIPGLILFSVFGVGSFVVLFGVLRRHRWAWFASVGLGIALVGWIVTQIFLIQTVNVLHLVYGGLGVILAVLSLTPSFRKELGQ
jgi:uncharacterized BrkB/YihY/UPF0761 family membrane protein